MLKRGMVTYASAAGVLLFASMVSAAVSDSFSAGNIGPHPKAIAMADAAGGTVLAVKLPLEKGVKVHLARLYLTRGPAKSGDELLADVEVFAGKGASGKPLAAVGPWFDYFNVSEAAKSAVDAGGELNLFVKAANLQKEQTRLEVWHAPAGEGKSPQAPPAVKEVNLLHRAGQTFITWQEVSPLAASEKLTWGEYKKALADAADAVTYRVYCLDKPITAQTLLNAQLLAEVAPLSAWNANGRNMEYLIGQAMDKSDVIGELAENTGGLMYTWGPDSARMDRYGLSRFVIDEKAGPLTAGTGLYVHTPGSVGKRYYAVVASRGGVENVTDITAANAPDKPVDEVAGVGEPVCQGDGLWGPFFDYPGQRKVYVQWCGPPLSPLPSMYFNWSVLVPPDRKPVLEPDGKAPAAAKASLRPVELYFHGANFSYAKPRKKYLAESIQIAPHDFPFSGWYGFNSSYQTLNGCKSGMVSNHTQKRIIAFLDWAKARLPADADRIMLPGGDGAALLALNYPDVFSYVLISRFESILAPPGNTAKAPRGPSPQERAEAAFGPIWGPKSPDVKDDQGRANWSWAMLDELVAAARRDLPLFCCQCESWGLDVAAFGRGKGRFYAALGKFNQPLTVNWNWGPSAPMSPDRLSGLWRGIDLARTTPVIAFANCTVDGNNDGNGQINGFSIWQGLKEDADSFEAVVSGRGSVDLTPRRCQAFKPKPGEKLAWQASPLPDPKAQSLPAPQGGQVTADANGAVTIKGLSLAGPAALKISRAK